MNEEIKAALSARIRPYKHADLYALTPAQVGAILAALDASVEARLLKALQGMLEVYGITAADYERRGIGSASEVALCDEARAAVDAARAAGGAA